jgi:site-specific recombinase XerD
VTLGFRVVFEPKGAGISPYRLLGPKGSAVDSINEFLDDLALRRRSQASLRSYGFALLDALRWAFHSRKDLLHLREVDLHDYVRFQCERRPERATTINHRLAVLSAFSRYHHEKDLTYALPAGASLGVTGRRGRFGDRTRRSLRLKEEHRVIRPLLPRELRRFLESLRTWRDLALVHLLLFSGLRSKEVLGLTLEDIDLDSASVRVQGKGRKERVVPISPQSASLLSSYLELERPRSSSTALFLSLKGPQRAKPMTAAGLRSLFRHHRRRTGVTQANPHRFRHTFGTRAVKAGMSLAVLKTILGHAHIDTTLRYVAVSDPDVFGEFERVARALRGELDRGDAP